MRVAALAAALIGLSSQAAAQRGMMTVWNVEAAEARPDPFQVGPNDYVIRQRLLPMGLAELTGAAPGLGAMTAGKQLIELQGGGAAIFCDPVIRAKKLLGHAQLCLIDADRDGRFDSYFETSSVTKGIVTIQGSRPKRPTALEPVAYRRIDPRQFDQQLFLGVQYRGNANIFGNFVFEIRYGSEGQMGSLTRRILHKKANLPGSTDVLSGRFSILESGSGGIKVRIDTPLPPQPFGIFQTTTYRIY
ncbi:MAG: hypothetical protein ACXW2T_01845 [Allosphingosinicella sp.]